jgi:hypothetical protein
VKHGVLRADLTDYGQAVEVLQRPDAIWWQDAMEQHSGPLLDALCGTDAVIHLANIPAPDLATPAVTFNATAPGRYSATSPAIPGATIWLAAPVRANTPTERTHRLSVR